MSGTQGNKKKMKNSLRLLSILIQIRITGIMKKTFYVFELPSFLFFIVLMMTTTGRYDNHNAQILSYVKELKEGNIFVRREINYASYSLKCCLSAGVFSDCNQIV